MANVLSKLAHDTDDQFKNEYRQYVKITKSTPITEGHVSYNPRKGGVQYQKPMCYVLWYDIETHKRFNPDWGTGTPV